MSPVFSVEVVWVMWEGFESEGERAAELWLKRALPWQFLLFFFRGGTLHIWLYLHEATRQSHGISPL